MSTDIVVGCPPRGRRTRTTIATAGAVLLALFLTLLSPLGTAKAFAIDDANDVNWDISGGRNSYQQMINDVRGRVGDQILYGNGSPGTVRATERTADYFLVNVHDGPNLLTRIVINAQNLYVQGYYSPRDHTYHYTRDASLQDVNWLPSSSTEPNYAAKLPFSGSYAESDGLLAYGGQTRRDPMFATFPARDNANVLSDPNAANSRRAQALLWFVEAISEGARFNAISDRIINAWTDSWGYHFDADDERLVTSWQTIGDTFQQRLEGRPVAPPAPIGRYDFSTYANTAAIICLMLWWSPTS
ncbi:ribosome-inactivating family protein [Streptomyces capitiformicae]|uniref:Uncharacterized protein n=1 Tax=Streptomyces capitiformicae TaxID=2014920 RepID=A0A919DBC8_9ACTN|nr:ribosome-inactivating family protein [Streptomyces capitiformicae]GHE31417.1 hypothetical protein GCM10017771_47790 [Streptomyces capitiformicae]